MRQLKTQQQPLTCCLDETGIWEKWARGDRCAGEVTPAVRAEVAAGPARMEPQRWDQLGNRKREGQPLVVPLSAAIWLSPFIPVAAGRIPCVPGLSRGGLGSDLTFGQETDWPFGQRVALRGFASRKVWVKWSTLPSPKTHMSTQKHIHKHA